MVWKKLTEVNQLEEIALASHEKAQLIFKHSTRCSISATALNRFEKAWDAMDTPAYYLDLIAYRPISTEIAEKFGIEHQSPQVLVIKDGQCTYSATHWDISVEDIKPELHS